MLSRVTGYVTIYLAVCTMGVHCDWYDEKKFHTLVQQQPLYALHSKPGLPKVVYLDFGVGNHIDLGETCWGGGGVCGPVIWGAEDERTHVEYIWAVIAEAYSPFEVDVTTEYVGGNNDFILRSNASDERYGIRVIFSECAVPPPGGSGVAGYVGIYDRIDDKHECPILMGTPSLYYWMCYMARAATHEVGHAFGLNHMHSVTAEYYGGIAAHPGCLGWAPVMGWPLYVDMPRFSNGEYPNFVQGDSTDELAIIATFVPYTPDDAPNTAPGLDLQIGPNLTYTFKGCISNSSDQDWFRVGAAEGMMSVTVLVALPTSSLDIDLTLVYNSTSVGTLQKTFSNDPSFGYYGYPTFGPTVISYNVSTAGYFDIIVKGQGCGTGDRGGYNAYGSIGTYTLTILVTAPWSPPTTTPTPNTTTAQTTTPTPTPTVTPTSSTALYATAAAVAGMLILSVVAFTLM